METLSWSLQLQKFSSVKLSHIRYSKTVKLLNVMHDSHDKLKSMIFTLYYMIRYFGICFSTGTKGLPVTSGPPKNLFIACLWCVLFKNIKVWSCETKLSVCHIVRLLSWACCQVYRIQQQCLIKLSIIQALKYSDKTVVMVTKIKKHNRKIIIKDIVQTRAEMNSIRVQIV